MTKLYDHLLNRDSTNPLWVLPDGVNVFKKDLLTRLQVLQPLQRACSGKKIALKLSNASSFIEFAVLLDGFCDSVLLVHPELSSKQQELLLNTFGTQICLSDDYVNTLADLSKESSSTHQEVCNTNWVIPTSGTTGTPKLISHSLNSLVRTVSHNNALKEMRWGLIYGITRFAGLQVFLQSFIGGGTLLIPDTIVDITALVDYLARHNCNALSATPAMWRKILMSPDTRLDLRQITLGGEIVDQKILDILHAQFPSAKIIHIYASTEAGVGFVVKDGLAGFPQPWIETSVRETHLKIIDELLWIKTNKRFEQKQKTENIEIDADGFINTGDLVRCSNNRVYFLGRLNGTINVGGNKVSPEEVESVLLNHPLVRIANVYARSNPLMGALVNADIVLVDEKIEKNDAKKQLLAYCRRELLPYKVPAMIKFVDDINLTAAGKVLRR